MKFIYIIFFATLNLLIFSHLTKKIKLSLNTKMVLVALSTIFAICHFINIFSSVITNEVFYILLLFSISLYIFHYGRNIAVWFTTKLNNNTKDELLFKWFNFWINYVMYILIFVFQIATLIDY